jgi:tetratricopeptide (TPR) repeat protein
MPESGSADAKKFLSVPSVATRANLPMPFANPESSFESAARHLMRHLCDPGELRRNPLVRSSFTAKEVDGDAAVLTLIHDRILAAWDALSQDQPASSKARYARRREILAAMCASELPTTTAARLRISIHHYYRERRTAGAAVCRGLASGVSPRVPRFTVADSAGLLLARAVLLRDQGLAGKAILTLESALSDAQGSLGTMVRSETARALLSLGDTSGALSMLAEGPDIDSRGCSESEVVRAAEHRAFTRALIGFETGGDVEAAVKLEALVKSKVAQRRGDEETIDAIVRCGDWYCQTGNFAEGRKLLGYAREAYRRLPYASGRQEGALALLAAHCAQESRDEFGLEHQWLAEALTSSVANGSTTGTLGALGGLMNYSFSIGRSDETYDLAVKGLNIAQETEGNQLLSVFILQCAAALLRTRRWRSVAPLVFESERLFVPGSLKWTFLKQFQGIFRMRCGQYNEAQHSLEPAYQASKRIGNRWLEGMLLRDLATAQHRSGRVEESENFMREAVGLVEGSSSAVSLWATYDAAARVLRDRRLTRLAEQLKASLTASADAAPPPSRHSVDPTAGAASMLRLSTGTRTDSALRLRILTS